MAVHALRQPHLAAAMLPHTGARLAHNRNYTNRATIVTSTARFGIPQTLNYGIFTRPHF